MKRIYLTLVFLVILMSVTAQTTFISNGIIYKTTSVNTVEVTFGGTYTGNITIPSTVLYSGFTYNVASIGEYAFYSSTDLTSLTIPSSVTSIGNYAFNTCTGLTSISIPSSVTSIGDYAFFYCTSLPSITIPTSVTSIGDYVCYKCSSLTSITIPSSVTSIGKKAFSLCTELKDYFVDSHNSIYASVDGVLFNKDMDTLIAYPYNKSPEYTIPPSVTSIGAYAFNECSGLTSITIPTSIVSIGKWSFYLCTGLTSIAIPSSVTSIGDGAFYKCSNLSVIHCQNVTPPSISMFAFYYLIKSTCKLYVPIDSYLLYWRAPVWRDFTTILEEEVTAVNAIKTNDIAVYAEQNDIVVKGLGIEETIFVYNIMGELVKTVKATSDVRIPSSSDQVYLVRIGSKSFKVAL